MRMRILENYKTLLANCESHGGLLKATNLIENDTIFIHETWTDA